MPGRSLAPSKLAQHPEVRAVSLWLDEHAEDVEDSAFWREYARNPDPDFRLRALAAWFDRKAAEPLPALRRGRAVSPVRLRVLVTIAYLRGRQTPPGVARIARPWTWTEIEDFANTHAEREDDESREWMAFANKAKDRFAEASSAGNHVVYSCSADWTGRLMSLLSSIPVGVSTGVKGGPTTAKRDATLPLVTSVDGDGQGD